MKILCIAPYNDLIETATKVLVNTPYQVSYKLGNLQTGLEIAKESISAHMADVIVSRGGTATLLRQNISIPVFEIEVSGYDLLRAMFPYVKHRKQLAVIGYENVISGARSIADILGISVKFFLIQTEIESNKCIEEAIKWGAEVVLGDTVSVDRAKTLGISSELIRSGRESIAQAFSSATKFYQHMQDELIRNRRLEAIMEHTDQGVLYLSSNGTIKLANQKICKFFGCRQEQLVGKTISQLNLPEDFSTLILTGVSVRSRILLIRDLEYLIDVLPLHTNSQLYATLIFIQSTGKVRDLEIIVRQQTVAQGLTAGYSFDLLIAIDNRMKTIIEKARDFSQTNSTILLLGETGTGKEVFAQSIHNSSPRRNGPFVAVNCAALPDTLLESELFGYAEGSFTGARKGGKAGLFELAHTGTIFLDEINEMSSVVQARFLRVIQEKQIMRIGDNRVFDVDVRIIAATNRDLIAEIESGRFRKDLYYRIRVLDIEIPPLRHRSDDIIPLFIEFIRGFKRIYNIQQFNIPEELLSALVLHPWPGNIRQLRNFAEKTSVLMLFQGSKTEIIQELIDELKSVGNKEYSEKNNYQRENYGEIRAISDLEVPGESTTTIKSQTNKKNITVTIPVNSSNLTLKQLNEFVIREAWIRNKLNISETARQLGINRATVRKHLQESEPIP